MRKMLFTTALLLLALAVPAWSGQFGDYKPHGCLSDYAKLRPEGGDSKAYKYRDPKADEAKYDKLIVDRIKIYLKEV